MTYVPVFAPFEIVTTRTGAVSIRDNATQEIMHNPVGPWAEANSLYIDQSRMRSRLAVNLPGELVVFDVGLGAASNALAALHCARGLKQRRALKLVSFERDLELLRFALRNAHCFSHFEGFESAVQSILDHGHWQESGIEWQLRHGDFLSLIDREEERAHIVFYDPYSFKQNSEMWTTEAFTKVHRVCVRSETEGGILLTYSQATPIRVGMLLAGFFVGAGLASGPKEETTEGGTRLEDLANPLGRLWLGRWQRSARPCPAGVPLEQLPSIRQFLVSHPQFR